MLGIHLRTQMRYDSGEREVPTIVMDRLYGMLIKRHGETGKLIGKIGDLRDARKEAS